MADPVTSLIQEYEMNHSNIWNASLASYSDRNMRRDSHAALCSCMGLDISEESIKIVKGKLNSLRTTFGRELRKVKESQKSGASTDDIYHPQWKYFNSLKFLTPYCTQRKGKNNMESNSENTEDNMPTPNNTKDQDETGGDIGELLQLLERDEEKENTHHVENVTDYEEENEDPSENHRGALIQTQPKTAAKKLNTTKGLKRTASSEALELLSSISATMQNREKKSNNSFVAFGRYIAAEMSEMDPNNAKLAKREIMDILFQYSN